MSKALVVFKNRLLIPNGGDFLSVYGPIRYYDHFVEVGGEIVARFMNDDVSYIVEGLEGTWLEPSNNTADTLLVP